MIDSKLQIKSTKRVVYTFILVKEQLVSKKFYDAHKNLYCNNILSKDFPFLRITKIFLIF